MNRLWRWVLRVTGRAPKRFSRYPDWMMDRIMDIDSGHSHSVRRYMVVNLDDNRTTLQRLIRPNRHRATHPAVIRWREEHR